MKSLLVMLTLLLSSAVLAGERGLPNIVLLIGDDHGYPYFGFMGDDNVITPAMDALAAGGVTFTQGHTTAPYCRPALRTLATGLHPIQYQLQLNEHFSAVTEADSEWDNYSDRERAMWTSVHKANGMRTFDTLPSLLSGKGYVSWQGGKWWENSYENGHFDEGMSGGWDMETFGTDQFFHEMMGHDGNTLVRENMEQLFDFIDRHEDEPMFIWFGPMLPHTPLDAPYRFRKFYADADISESAKLYYANITWWDQGVSDLMDYVESKGLLEDTLFIYINDNGYEQDADKEYVREDGSISVELAGGGLKGKSGIHDISFRTPVIFYWKDHLTASMDHASLISALDIVPTILDIVDVPVPKEMRGHSLLPLLNGEQAVLNERSELIGYTNNRRSENAIMGEPVEGYYLRNQRWHFLWYAHSGEQQLYDMTLDPRGETDQSADYPQLVAEFKARIEEWKLDIGMPVAIDIHE